MAERVYTILRVHTAINVSSSSDYFGGVIYTYHDKRIYRDVHLNNGTVMGLNDSWDVKMPQYFMRELWRLYREVLAEGAKFYEYDRDKNKRWENLRYHDQRMVDHMIEWMGKEANEPRKEVQNGRNDDVSAVFQDDENVSVD
jgi:hypothetical protein